MNTKCKQSARVLRMIEKKLDRIWNSLEDKENLSKLQLQQMLFAVTLKEVKLCALHRSGKALTTEAFKKLL